MVKWQTQKIQNLPEKSLLVQVQLAAPMKVNQVVKLIADNLSDKYLNKKYLKTNRNKFSGHCYLASEIAYHLLGGKNNGWKSYQMIYENTSHWFLKHKSGYILDITAKQFNITPTKKDYDLAKGKGFLTKNLSKRSQSFLKEINVLYKTKH